MSKRFGRNQRRKLREQVEQTRKAVVYWCNAASTARAAEALYKRQNEALKAEVARLRSDASEAALQAETRRTIMAARHAD